MKRRILIEMEVDEDNYAIQQNLDEKPCPEECPFYMNPCSCEKINCLPYLMSTAKIVNFQEIK